LKPLPGRGQRKAVDAQVDQDAAVNFDESLVMENDDDQDRLMTDKY